MKQAKKSRYESQKRMLDVIFSVWLLVLLALPMVVIACLIRLTSSGHAIFRQIRIGRNGKPFVCYKFRTMRVDAPSDCPAAELVEAERWITPIGRFLRRSSLDELPQLWNVLRGEMSLVGPRPLIPKEQTVHEFRRRCGVSRLRPGMTGLAQICGRKELDDREKARLDSRYAHRMGFAEDARIVWHTLACVWEGGSVPSMGRSDCKG